MQGNAEPEVVELDAHQLEAKLDEIEQVMGVEAAHPFRLLLFWYLKLLNIVQLKNMSISRLRRLLFGKKTERLSDLLDPDQSPGGSVSDGDAPRDGGHADGDAPPAASNDANETPPPGKELERGLPDESPNTSPPPSPPPEDT